MTFVPGSAEGLPRCGYGVVVGGSLGLGLEVNSLFGVLGLNPSKGHLGEGFCEVQFQVSSSKTCGDFSEEFFRDFYGCELWDFDGIFDVSWDRND